MVVNERRVRRQRVVVFCDQGLTLDHLPAQRERFLLAGQGVFRGCLWGIDGEGRGVV